MAVVAAAVFCASVFGHCAWFFSAGAWREGSAGSRAWGIIGLLLLAALAVLGVLFFAHAMEACRADRAACPRPDYP
ncbi:hypothetical protein [Streptomyces fradiae]|uniref:hypothetical protein n=1 Tax=Streptomyces fradiae TaxID=1906 RepID=UPI0035BE9505